MNDACWWSTILSRRADEKTSVCLFSKETKQKRDFRLVHLGSAEVCKFHRLKPTVNGAVDRVLACRASDFDDVLVAV